MRRKKVLTLSIVAGLALAGGAATVAAHEHAPRVDPVVATFSFASAEEWQRFCPGEDGPYIEIRAHHVGTQTGDARLSGNLDLRAHNLVNLATGLGTSEGRFTIRDRETDAVKATGTYHGIFTEGSKGGAMFTARRAGVAALFAAAVTTIAAGVTQAAPGTPYTFHGTEQETFVDEGLCAPEAQIMVDSRFVLHVNATQAGLTQEQIEQALEDDESGLIVSATYTETGTFTAVEAGNTYTGRFTAWFGGNLNRDGGTVVFTGTFSVRGVDENGNRVSGAFVGHVTFVNGKPIVDFEKGHINGCPGA